MRLVFRIFFCFFALVLISCSNKNSKISGTTKTKSGVSQTVLTTTGTGAATSTVTAETTDKATTTAEIETTTDTIVTTNTTATTTTVTEEATETLTDFESSTPYSISIEANDGQSALLGTVVALPFIAIVKDANGNPVSGIIVDWSVTSGGGSLLLTSSVTTVDGTASNTLTLGSILGVNTVTASISSGTPNTVVFTATAFGNPTKLVFSVQPANTLANSGINPAIVVNITDSGGNIVKSATNTVTLAIQNNPTTGVLVGTLDKAAVLGAASFTDLSIDHVGLSYTLLATASGLTSATSLAFNITAELSLVGPEAPISSACSLYRLNLKDGIGNPILSPDNINIILDPNSYFVSSDTDYCSNSLGTQITTTTIASGSSLKEFYLRPQNENNIQLEFNSDVSWLVTNPILSNAITTNTSPGETGSFEWGSHLESLGFVSTDFGGNYDSLWAIALQTDGKILLAGSTEDNTMRDFALVRYNANGSLDNTFGTGGKLTTDFAGNYESAEAIALQSDGKILLAGQTYDGMEGYFVLARYNTDGSLDNTFGTGGMVATSLAGNPTFASAIVLQQDGKIILGGSSNSDFALARYNTDGSLDITFGTNGKVTTDFAGDDLGGAMVLQTDGKIILAGYTDSSSNYDFALARYNTDGSLDNTFGTGGKVTTDFAGHDDVANKMVLQPDGKIILAGYTDSVSNYSPALVRYNSDGSLDNTFGTAGGKVVIPSFESDFLGAIALQSDGKIILATTLTTLMSYNTDGTLDKTFGNSSFIQVEVGYAYTSTQVMALQSDGKILLAGGASGEDSNQNFALARYNADWSLDDTFGEILVPDKNLAGLLKAVEQPDGRIILGGSSNYDFALARYNIDGSLDNTFGTGGKVTTDFAGNYDYARALALQSDGKILLAGNSNNGSDTDFALARYNGDGSLDSTFGTDGKTTTHFGNNDFAFAIALQSDSKIIIAGYINNGSNYDFALVRYNTDGSLDNTFGTGGKVTTDFSGHGDYALQVGIQSDGKIILGGSSNYDFALARYNTDGSLDNTFGTDGKVTTDFAGNNDYARALALQLDGKIILAGSTEDEGYDFALARYNIDGSLDNTFGTGGKITAYSVESDFVNTMTLQSDGKIVLGINSSKNSVARYNPDGSLDNEFGTNGKVEFDMNASNESLVIQVDGKILAVGRWGKSTAIFRLWP